MGPKAITTPLADDVVRELQAGDRVTISGVVYTGRDAAHQRLMDLLAADRPLPIELAGQVIYYCGPAPTPPGRPIGSCGPTTSYRMDAFTPRLHELGLRGTIGKGDRSLAVREACQRHGAVYFAAIGGAGALLAQRVVDASVVAYEDLGPEAIRRLCVEDLPVIVAYDCHGGSVFPGDDPL